MHKVVFFFFFFFLFFFFWVTLKEHRLTYYIKEALLSTIEPYDDYLM